MTTKFDFKKENKEQYKAKAGVLADVSVKPYKVLEICGESNLAGPAFSEAIQTLHPLAYTIKFMPKKGLKIPDYKEYVVAPMEGRYEPTNEPGVFKWTIMVPQPDFVTAKVVTVAKRMLFKKGDLPRLNEITFSKSPAYTALQTLHIGPYDQVGIIYEALQKHCSENDLVIGKESREIYLSDPRRTPPEKLKTIVRMEIQR